MEKERLEFTMGRFDHYYDSINNKSIVFLTLELFITGGLVTAYPTLLAKVNCGTCLHLLMGCILSAGLAIMLIVAWIATPFFGKSTGSLLFFKNIAEQPSNVFEQRSQNETVTSAKDDLRRQVYELACGLSRKFRKMKTAGVLLIIQIALFIPLITMIIIYLKK
jgi:hypothetical protein